MATHTTPPRVYLRSATTSADIDPVFRNSAPTWTSCMMYRDRDYHLEATGLPANAKISDLVIDSLEFVNRSKVGGAPRVAGSRITKDDLIAIKVIDENPHADSKGDFATKAFSTRSLGMEGDSVTVPLPQELASLLQGALDSSPQTRGLFTPPVGDQPAMTVHDPFSVFQFSPTLSWWGEDSAGKTYPVPGGGVQTLTYYPISFDISMFAPFSQRGMECSFGPEAILAYARTWVPPVVREEVASIERFAGSTLASRPWNG